MNENEFDTSTEQDEWVDPGLVFIALIGLSIIAVIFVGIYLWG